MKMDFTNEEYRTLLELLDMAQHVMTPNGDDECDDDECECCADKAKYEDLCQKIYSMADDFGAGNLVAFEDELNCYFTTDEFEESDHKELIETFAQSSFWSSLIMLMAERDATKEKGEEVFDNLSDDEQGELLNKYAEQYAVEFMANGLDNLLLNK